MATIKTGLYSPESGWKRIYANNSDITKIGGWTNVVTDSSNASLVGNISENLPYLNSTAGNDSLYFSFTGTKFRIMADYFDANSSTISIYMDGVLAGTTSLATSSASIYCALCYENLNLTNSRHNVKIVNSGSKSLQIRSFDIDAQSDFYNIYYDKIRNSFSEMSVGDLIKCRYTYTAISKLGYFWQLGNPSGTELSLTGDDYPDGWFYFRHVGYDHRGRMKLIADRNIQRSISYDELNAGGVVTGIDFSKVCKKFDTITGVTEVYRTSGGVIDGPAGWMIHTMYSPHVDFKLSDITNVTRIAISCGDGVTNYYPIKQLQIMGSNDGVSYTPIDLISGEGSVTVSGSIATLVNLGSPGGYQYIRCNCNYKYLRFIPKSGYNSNGYISIYGIGFETNSNPTYDSSTYTVTTKLLTGGITTNDRDNEWDKIICESTIGGTIVPGDNFFWNWKSLYSWTITSTNTNLQLRIGRGNSASNTSNTNSTSVTNATIGYRPMLIVENLNNDPVIKNLNCPTTFYNKPIRLQATVQDQEQNSISCNIYINTKLYKTLVSNDNTILVDELISLSSDSTIKLEAIDSNHGKSTSTINIYKKMIDLTHISYSNPNNNYLESYNIVDPTNIALYKLNLNKSNGYIKNGVLKLNVNSGGGLVQIGLIKSYWTIEDVTYNTKPQFDEFNITTFVGGGINEINITALLKKLYTQSNYGLYISTTNANITLDIYGTDEVIDFQPTELLQPQVVYGNRCWINWRPLVYYKPNAFERWELCRATKSDFSDELSIFQSYNVNQLQFLDDSISLGTYYYRIKIHFLNFTYIGDQLDFDFSDEGKFIQQDSESGTDFDSGVVRTHLSIPETNVDWNIVNTSYTSNIQLTNGSFSLIGKED